jgi:hypothetical protein
MQTMLLAALASSLTQATSGRPRLDPRDVELDYTGPRHGLGDVARVAVALSGVALYAAVLAYVAQ